MNILAIDTSNLPLSIAVIDENKVLGELATNVEKNHSIRLMPLLKTLLNEVQISPQELDLIAVARGPGSYTGVRIGVTTAKSMAWALKKPLIGVSSLMGLAHQIPFFDGLIIPLFDARRERVYTGGYAWKQGELVEVIPEQILHIADLANKIKELERKALFVGDDVSKHRASFIDLIGERAEFLPNVYHLPRAAHIAQIGLRLYQQGKEENLGFAPSYLQVAEAEARLMGE